MNKQIITFDANEQSLIKTGGVDKYSSNKVSYIEAHFNLGENWQGYDSVRAVWSTWYECISTVLDTEGICIVPYEVLKRTDKVMVNLVGSISEDDVLTDRITTYPIKALEVDADAKVCGSNTQPITPSEYEQFVEAVKADADRAEEAKDEARGFASSAEISAQNASISETNASTSEDNAKASELNAETYKNQAQTYAQNANNSAISAENAKDEAEDARDTILGMRAEATTLPEGSSATASYNDGVMSFGIPKGDTGATGATGETGATPQLSIGTVETTTEPIVTITGTAENPVLNFGLVKGDKGDTGEVSLADLSTLLPTDTASGAIASFPDGQSVIPALSVVADIEPIQSLNGYDKPWSGGNGKNKLPTTATTQTINGITFTVNDDGTIKVNGTATADAQITVGRVNVSGGSYTFSSGVNTGSINTYYARYVARDSNGTAISIAGSLFIDVYDIETTKTLPNNVAFVDGYVGVKSGITVNNLVFKPMIRLSSETDATWQPYSNICPISGRTEVVTQRTGVNVWDEEWEVGAIVNGANYTSSSNIRSTNYIPCSGGTTYYSRCSAQIVLFQYDANKSLLKPTTDMPYILVNANTTFTTLENTQYMRFYVQPAYGTTYNNDISINYPSTDHDYHAYQGETYTTDLGRTVYGGEAEIVGGSLTDTHKSITINSDTNFTMVNATHNCYTSADDAKRMQDYKVSMKCDKMEVVHSAGDASVFPAYPNWVSGYYYSQVSQNQNWIYWHVDGIESKADMIAWLAENPLQVVYELATPQTYQLTPTEVQTLLGQNNIWADTGDVEVTYKADVTKWLEKQLS